MTTNETLISPISAGQTEKEGTSLASEEKDGRKLSPQEIVDGLKKLRDEQIGIAGKLREMESEKNEHRLVIESLEEVEGDRKCFRLVSGVLVERTVSEVLPALRKNVEQISSALETLAEQLVSKGKELNTYREKHNIRIQGEDDHHSHPGPGGSASKSEESLSKKSEQNSAVLVRSEK